MNLGRYFHYITRKFTNHTSLLSSYESDGKTTATILNEESDSGLMIDSYSMGGFRLNNGFFAVGPISIFPKTVLSWNVAGDEQINEDSLTLFTVLEPTLDILIIGHGGVLQNRSKVEKDLLLIRNKYKINFELLPVEKAVATFNFLCAEGRWVGAGLIPPLTVKFTDDDIMSKRTRQKLITDNSD